MRKSAAVKTGQDVLPIQPVEQPIICRPYVEPDSYWQYEKATGQAVKQPGRRPSKYWYKDKTGAAATAAGQTSLELDEGQDELAIVNDLREDVRRWRNSNYEGATNITKDLLRHWNSEDRPRRLFFCQREAVETVIFLNEIRGMRRDGKRGLPRFTPRFTDTDFAALRDIPNEPDGQPLMRYGCKMATGTGKTVVMSMLIAWAFCNRGQAPSDDRFPRAALVCCPNLTVKERLAVLRPESPSNYYAAFDLVPARLRPLLNSGKVLVTNWHQFKEESAHMEGGKTYGVVQKGRESREAFARRVLGDLYGSAPLMVLNDEAHHAYRPAPLPEEIVQKLTPQEKAEREEATIWISGIDRFNASCGVTLCVDLSATPFYLHGSGYPEGSPFPWLVSDFGLVDAIESGLVKIPRLPVADTTGRPEAKYFNLYRNIVDALPAGDRLPGRARKPKPEALWRDAQDALLTLAGQYQERFDLIQAATSGQDKSPPVLILVCDNTDIAQLFFENISGERQIDSVDEAAEEDDDEDDSEEPQRKKKKPKKKVVFSDGLVGFSDLFGNEKGFRPTLRVDSKVLEQAESGEEGGNRQDAAERLREVIATVGKPGQPGEQVRCVVSVSMLTEGWDANNVTHILGLRAFTSQLLCEQVVGRGLRRMDYTVNADGFLEPEYVDVYGIPFSLIPYKGRPTSKSAPEDKPKNHVLAMPERAAYEIRFPVVEGYAFSLRKNAIKADVSRMEGLEIEPNLTPTAVFVSPSVGYKEGVAGGYGPGEGVLQNREAFYASTHRQAIEFEIARRVVLALVGDNQCSPISNANPRLQLTARHQLFPQVLRIVQDYVARKVNFHGANPCELGLVRYVERVIERLVAAIEPDDEQGELPRLPLLNRYKPFGSTAEVDFKTTRRCYLTQKSHLNQVVLDTLTWESSAAFWLEQSPHVLFYARNEGMGFTIPYEYDGINHAYEPDFLVRMPGNRIIVLEVKGYEDDQTLAKHQAAKQWVEAINNYDKGITWGFTVCRDPAQLGKQLQYLANTPQG